MERGTPTTNRRMAGEDKQHALPMNLKGKITAQDIENEWLTPTLTPALSRGEGEVVPASGRWDHDKWAVVQGARREFFRGNLIPAFSKAGSETKNQNHQPERLR